MIPSRNLEARWNSFKKEGKKPWTHNILSSALREGKVFGGMNKKTQTPYWEFLLKSSRISSIRFNSKFLRFFCIRFFFFYTFSCEQDLICCLSLDLCALSCRNNVWYLFPYPDERSSLTVGVQMLISATLTYTSGDRCAFNLLLSLMPWKLHFSKMISVSLDSDWKR